MSAHAAEGIARWAVAKVRPKMINLPHRLRDSADPVRKVMTLPCNPNIQLLKLDIKDF